MVPHTSIAPIIEVAKNMPTSSMLNPNIILLYFNEIEVFAFADVATKVFIIMPGGIFGSI